MSFLSRWIEADSLRERNRKALRLYEQEHPSADVQGKTECCRSGRCCWRRPGCLDHDDVPKIAALLGLTSEELFQQYLVVDSGIGDSTGYVLVPRRKHQEGGEMLDWRETYSFESPCVFLGEGNACQVHDVKPVACREYKCWEGDSENYPEWSREQLMSLGWSGYDPDE
jgi:Fe-S-cluster containining protein